jgi:AcrR family transcriptional regulator
MSDCSEIPLNRAQKRSERHQTIVEGAAMLFAEVGYSDCEMERLASSLAIGKGTLYLYFPGKQELFYACVDWGMTKLNCALRSAMQDVEEPFEKIGQAFRAYLVFFEDHPQFVELLLQERAIFKARKCATYFEHRDANRPFWRELYSGLIESGRLRSDLPLEPLLDTIGNLLYGTMFTNHFIGRKTTLEDQYRTLMEAVFRGLLSDSERPVWQLPDVNKLPQ